MGNYASSGGRDSGGLQESDERPLGGGSSGGEWKQKMTVHPFDISPQDVRAALGTKGKAIGIEEAMKGANPFYSDAYYGAEFRENCQRAVVAYELRRRGYDVAALPTFPGDDLPVGSTWAKAFKNPVETPVGVGQSPTKTQAKLEQTMKSYGNGARGIVTIPGHVFNVENVGGKIRYIDAQTNTVYNSDNVFKRVGKRSQSITLIRTDKLGISDDAKKSVTPVTETMRNIRKNRANK